MSFIFSLMQLIGWVLTGYSMAKHNYWSVACFVLINIVLGLVQAMSMVGEELKNGNSNRSKRSR